MTTRMALLIAFVGVSACQAQTGAVQHVHDPCVIKHGEHYYVFSTGHGIPIRRSRDLVQWESIGKVFDNLPPWAKQEIPGVQFPWAPDISHFNGRYHLYYSISTFGSNTSCVGLATNKTLDLRSPDYHWIDQGIVVRSRGGRDNWNAIDPNIVLDEAGKPRLSFGSFWSGIKLVAVDLRTGKPTRTPPELHAIASRPGTTAVEAPFIVRRGGYYYLFVSFDACCKGVNSTYNIVVGRSEKVTGPYRDRKGTPMTEGGGTLVLAGYDHVRGPGHNAVLSTETGDWLVHHYYDGRAEGIPTLQVRPLLWATDGWPLAGEPVDDVAGGKAGQRDFPGRWRHSVNFGAGNDIQYEKNGKIGNGPATWAVKGSTLTLRWPRKDAPGGVWVDECVLSPDKRWYVGRNQQDMLIRGHRVVD